MSDIKCNLVVIRSQDLDISESFYKALQLEFTRHAHGRGPVHLACELQGFVFEIYPLSESTAPTTSTRIGFRVPSVDATYTAALAAGGTSVSAPADSEWGRRAVVADPDGHRIELTA